MRQNIFEDDSHKEMSFIDHLESLRWHLIRALGAIFLGAIIAFFNKAILFDFLLFGPTRADFPTNKFLCYLSNTFPFLSGLCMKTLKYNFINTDLAGQFMLHIKMSAMAGFILAFPYVFWEIWRFIKPALYNNELKYTRGIVFFTSILFVIGCMFGYFIIAPFSINFLYSYQTVEIAQNFISIDNYISNVTSMVIPTGIMFELPMLVYFLTKIGLITADLMRNTRKFASVIILIVISIITPQGDMFSLLLISAPIFMLYELSIIISAKVDKQIAKDFN